MQYKVLIFIICVALIWPALLLTQQCGAPSIVPDAHNQCLMDTVAGSGFEYWQANEVIGMTPHDMWIVSVFVLFSVLAFVHQLILSRSYIVFRNAILMRLQLWRLFFGNGWFVSFL